MQIQSEAPASAQRDSGSGLATAVWVLVAAVAVLAVVTVMLLVRVSSLEGQVQQASSSNGIGIPSSASPQQVDDVCRLLGAIAAKDGIAIASVFDAATMTTCESAAQAGADSARFSSRSGG
jgi:hypothetical protein